MSLRAMPENSGLSSSGRAGLDQAMPLHDREHRLARFRDGVRIENIAQEDVALLVVEAHQRRMIFKQVIARLKLAGWTNAQDVEIIRIGQGERLRGHRGILSSASIPIYDLGV